jgi:hypothetical protein
MVRNNLIILFVFIFPILLFGQYNEVEPNNTREQANVLALGDSSTISAEFTSSADVDFYSIEMQDTTMYYLTSVENKTNVAPDIELFLEAFPGNVLTSNVGGRNGNSNFRLSGYVPKLAGSYYAKIFNTEATQGQYKIRLAGGRSNSKLLVHEPDNTLAFAFLTNALAEADTVYGALYPENDVDYYKISGTMGKQFTIGTTPILDLEARDSDTFIALYDQWGTLFTENDDIGTVATPSGSVNFTFSKMTGIFPSTGSFYVSVRSYYNVNFGQTISETHPPMGEYGIYYISEEASPPEVLARHSHVELPTLNSIVVQWNTVDPQKTLLLWGDNEVCSNVFEREEPVHEHLVKISGLEQESKYYYRVVIGDDSTECEYFYTAKPSTTEQVNFFVISDTSPYAGFGSTPQQLEVADQVLKTEYDFGLHGGDVNQHHGEEYDLVFYQPYKDILKNAPIFPCVGNHDTVYDNTFTYQTSFNLPHNNPDSTERYYSFNYGHAHFISIDTNSPYIPGSPQYEWLVQDLQSDMRSETMWTFAYFHKPPWSEGWPGYPGEAKVRTHLVPLFEQHGVDMTFSGHTHDYERGFLNGVYYIITGGGGAPLEQGIQAYDYDHVTVWINQHSFTHIQLDDKTLELKAINKDGEIIDRLVIDKQISDVEKEIPLTENGDIKDFILYSNYPNPFNQSTVVSYFLPQPTNVRIAVFSTLGQKVATMVNDYQSAGNHEVGFDAGDLPSGVYFYQIETENFNQQKKSIYPVKYILI